MYHQYPQHQPKIPRLTKRLAEQLIAMNIGVAPQQLSYIKLQETPQTWKHACVPTGVIQLTPNQLQYNYTVIDYAVCPACGKVQYHYESEQAMY